MIYTTFRHDPYVIDNDDNDTPLQTPSRSRLSAQPTLARRSRPRRTCDPNGDFHVEIQGMVVCWTDTDQDLLQMAGSQGGKGSKEIAAAYDKLVAQVLELREETVRLRAELARVSANGEEVAQRVDDTAAAMFEINEKVTQEAALLRGTADRVSGHDWLELQHTPMPNTTPAPNAPGRNLVQPSNYTATMDRGPVERVTGQSFANTSWWDL